jgi:hypothetical protein
MERINVDCMHFRRRSSRDSLGFAEMFSNVKLAMIERK